MSSFFDKAKEKAQQLGTAAKEKADDIKDKRKADDLLDDLGRITYAQRTNRGGADDEAKIAGIVEQLQALEAEGTPVLGEKEAPTVATAPPPPPPPPTA
jgi:hypothetical protein